MKMHVMLTTLAITALTSAATAAPCLSSDFTLAMSYNGQNVSLGAIESGRNGILNIVGFSPDSYRGTPLQVTGNGKAGKANLAFDIKKGDDCETSQTGIFGLYVPDLGESYGRQDPITATKALRWPHWTVGSNTVVPRLTAASQWFYACNITVQGQEHIGLSWGVYNSNGSAPYGCVITQVKQVFNIPCGD